MNTRKDKKDTKPAKDSARFFQKAKTGQCNVQQNVQVDVRIEQAEDCMSALFRCLKKAK